MHNNQSNGSVAVAAEVLEDAALAVLDRKAWEAERAALPRYTHTVQSDGKVVAEEEQTAAAS